MMKNTAHFSEILSAWQIDTVIDWQAIQADVFHLILPGEREIALKDLGPHRAQTIQRLYFEYDVLRHVEQTGLVVAVPLLSYQGKPFVIYKDHIFRCSDWLPNQPLTPQTSQERITLFQNYGAAIARFHQALATYQDADILTRTWQASFQTRVLDEAIPVILDQLDGDQLSWFRSLLAEIESDLPTAYADLPEQLIIWDCHPGNMARVGYVVTGFVDCNHIAIAPRIFDLANFLANILKWDVNDPEKAGIWLTHFRQVIVGYETVQSLTQAEHAGLFYGIVGVVLIMIDFFYQTARPELTELEFDTIAWLIQHRQAIEAELEL